MYKLVIDIEYPKGKKRELKSELATFGEIKKEIDKEVEGLVFDEVEFVQITITK